MCSYVLPNGIMCKLCADLPKAPRRTHRGYVPGYVPTCVATFAETMKTVLCAAMCRRKDMFKSRLCADLTKAPRRIHKGVMCQVMCRPALPLLLKNENGAMCNYVRGYVPSGVLVLLVRNPNHMPRQLGSKLCLSKLRI